MALASEPPADVHREEGRILLHDVYEGDLRDVERGSIRRLRVVGVPPKTDPRMNHPVLGVTDDDPGKFVLGTVPVEEDGSAYFRVPAGVPLFLQALDAEGMAVQTMRSVTYVQPAQTYSCVGCHENRRSAPINRLPSAALRQPSSITAGPEGSWPLDFSVLVQPVLERHCVKCHRSGAEAAEADLTPPKAYETLVSYGGERSLRQHVLNRYNERRSTAGACAARSSALLQLLREGHHEVELEATERERLITWMDCYAQVSGSFSPDQERRLRQLRSQLAFLLTAER
jgi:hypothetical protein